jgi:hypothetical protein
MSRSRAQGTAEIAFYTLCTGTAVEINLQSVVINHSSASHSSQGQGEDFLINLFLILILLPFIASKGLPLAEGREDSV